LSKSAEARRLRRGPAGALTLTRKRRRIKEPHRINDMRIPDVLTADELIEIKNVRRQGLIWKALGRTFSGTQPKAGNV
jgi:hypothetical protein